MKTNLINILCKGTFALLLIAPTSCTSFVEGLRPMDKLTTEEVFSDASTAEAAMVGVYSQQMTNWQTFFNRVGPVTSVSADDLTGTGSGQSVSLEPFNRNTILIDDGVNSSMWSGAYGTIYQCNAMITNLAASTSLDQATVSRLTGESLFLRAFLFFNLVNLFGDIPLPLTPDYRENAKLTRTSEAAVYQQILADLDAAYKALPNDPLPDVRQRANKTAVAALRARVHSYLKDWPNASRWAEEVLGNTQLTLEPLQNVFLRASKETILSIQHASSQTIGTGDGYFYNPASTTAIPDFELTPKLLAVFEADDLRRTNWVNAQTVNGITYHFPHKYKIKTQAGEEKGEYLVAFRLAEQYLIKAEALAEQNQLNDAIAALDSVRKRAGLSLISVTTPSIGKNELLTKIRQEKQTEYFAEWAHRWFDLKRWGMADAVLSPLKPDWVSTAAKFPIPWAELSISTFLRQNLGYPESI